MYLRILKSFVFGLINFLRFQIRIDGVSKKEMQLIHKIKNKNITYLSKERLVHLVQICRQIESQSINGLFIEAGCALGGSAILISKLKNDKREFQIYDVFGMIPPPTEMDPKEVHDRFKTISSGKSGGLGADKYYGYEENLINKVYSNFRSFGIDPEIENIKMIKGLIQQTMNLSQPVAFAHIDVDWYEPVKFSLVKIFHFLSKGGIIVLDDYHDWGGCKKATDEFLETVSGQYLFSDGNFGSVSITKIV